jgi:hypothetical protein
MFLFQIASEEPFWFVKEFDGLLKNLKNMYL